MISGRDRRADPPAEIREVVVVVVGTTTSVRPAALLIASFALATQKSFLMGSAGKDGCIMAAPGSIRILTSLVQTSVHGDFAPILSNYTGLKPMLLMRALSIFPGLCEQAA
jgi:hypothetical protein